MSVRGFTSVDSYASPLNVPVPAATKPGDVLVMWAVSDYADRPRVTYPVGWFVVPIYLRSTFDSSILTVGVKVASASEPATHPMISSAFFIKGGMIALSGVTMRGMRWGTYENESGAASPWPLKTADLHVSEPSEVLALVNSDVNAEINVVKTIFAPFALVQDFGSQWDNVTIAHRTMPTAGRSGAVIGTGAFTGVSAALLGVTLVFPKRQPHQRMLGLPSRTLRPRFDMSSTGWSAV